MDELDLDLTEAQEFNEVNHYDPRATDRRICICGHAMSRHHLDRYDGRHYCKPGALDCPCLQPREVIEVPNTRFFMRKSMGSGVKHALTRGIAASIDRLGAEEFEQSSKWLVDPICDICKEPSKFYPQRVTPTGSPLLDVDDDQGVTAFMCASCRDTNK